MYKPKRKVRVCVDCGCEVRSRWFEKTVEETRCNPCSKKGVRNNNWKGGQMLNSYGYVQIKKPEHPYTTKLGYVRRSHLVWEAANDRYVQPGEVIHHIDGVKDNDVIENLQLMTNSKHMSLHNSGKRNPAYKHGRRIGERAKYAKKKG